MPVLICPRDGAQNPAQALACEKCGARLSRVVVGQPFVHRYRILERLGEDEHGIRFAAEVIRTGAPCLLRELFPESVEDDRAVDRFARASEHLIRSRPSCLIPIRERFSIRGCFYIEEEAVAGMTLRRLIESSGKLTEEHGDALFVSLLRGLDELHGLEPPVFIGNLDSSKVLFASPDRTLLLEPEFLYSSIRRNGFNGEVLIQDLEAAGLVTVEGLAGKPALDPKVDRDLMNASLAELKRPGFASSLDWILSPDGIKPISPAQVLEHRELVQSGVERMSGGSWSEAKALLDRAYSISRSERVRLQLRILRNRQANEGRAAEVKAKPEPAAAKPVAPLSAPVPVSPPPARATVEKPKPAASVSAPPRAPVKTARQKSQASSWMAVACVAAGLALGMWYFSGREMRAFESQLRNGRLVEPVGSSAYDLYQRAVQERSASAREMGQKARPVLAAASNSQFGRWYSNSGLGRDDWMRLRRLHEWLATLDPSLPVLARYDYAKAQVAFLEGNYAKAMAGFRAALSKADNWDLALAGVAKTCFNLADYNCAEDFYLRAARTSPRWIWPHKNLMDLYTSRVRYNKARACEEYRKLRELSAPMNPAPFDRAGVERRMTAVCLQ